MLFKSILLHNFKMYAGTNIFDLSINYNEDTLKNIVLIGGLNGNGKTTILEAVQLCLYGKRVKHLFKSSEYEIFVSSRFSRNALKKGETQMKIIVEFEDVYLQSISHTMSVERTYSFATYSGSIKIVESNFIIRKDNGAELKPLSENEYKNEEAEDFLHGLIPPEISQFFFFDGEKIQEMAEDKNYGERISKALRDVLGISILEVLQDDLAEVRNRYSKSAKATEIKKEKTEKESEIATLEDLINKSEYRIFNLKDETKKLQNDIQDIDDDIKRITNVSIQNRDDLKNRESELSQFQKEIEEKLKDVLEFGLPLAISAKLCFEMKDRLEIEKAFKTQDKAKLALKPQLEMLLSEVFDVGEESKPKLHFTQKEFYKDKIRKTWYLIFDKNDKEMNIDEIWHDINEKQYNFIVSQIERVSHSLIPEFEKLIQEKQRTITELRNIQKNLKDEGDNEILSKVEKLKSLSGNLKAKEDEIKRLNDEIEKYRRQIQTLAQQKDKLEKNFIEAERTEQKVVFIQRLKEAISEYETELKKKKIAILENSIKDMFLRLCNKDDMISNIEIDIQTFIVSIIDTQGRKIEKHNLSSGLKQVFAFSLLWGLMQVSKIEIPVIIDTPFGRLDSVHRTNIIQNYYPNAGRQVIVLSTDTEIDKQNVKLLENSIEKTYLLHRRSELEPVHIKKDYF